MAMKILPAVLALLKRIAPLLAVIVTPGEVCKRPALAVMLMSPLVVLRLPTVKLVELVSVKLPPALDAASVAALLLLRLTTPVPPVVAEINGVLVVIAVAVVVPVPMLPVPELSVML